MKTVTINGTTFSYDDDLELTFTLKKKDEPALDAGGGGGGWRARCRFCDAGAGASGDWTHIDEEGRRVPCMNGPRTWQEQSGGGGSLNA